MIRRLIARWRLPDARIERRKALAALSDAEGRRDCRDIHYARIAANTATARVLKLEMEAGL